MFLSRSIRSTISSRKTTNRQSRERQRLACGLRIQKANVGKIEGLEPPNNARNRGRLRPKGPQTAARFARKDAAIIVRSLKCWQFQASDYSQIGCQTMDFSLPPDVVNAWSQCLRASYDASSRLHRGPDTLNDDDVPPALIAVKQPTHPLPATATHIPLAHGFRCRNRGMPSLRTSAVTDVAIQSRSKQAVRQRIHGFCRVCSRGRSQQLGHSVGCTLPKNPERTPMPASTPTSFHEAQRRRSP